jgi:hypothetical protein
VVSPLEFYRIHDIIINIHIDKLTKIIEDIKFEIQVKCLKRDESSRLNSKGLQAHLKFFSHSVGGQTLASVAWLGPSQARDCSAWSLAWFFSLALPLSWLDL